jgi:transposase
MIKSLTITRKRPVPVSQRWKWEAVFTVDLPEPEPSTSQQSCGIDLGWRKVEAGLRVATIADALGRVDHLVLPLEMMDRRARIASLKGFVVDSSREEGIEPTEHVDWRRLALEEARWVRRRRDIYRVVAAQVAQEYRLIGLDGGGIAAMAQDRRLPPETRRMRTWAAPAEFAAALRDAARARGAELREVQGASTVVCHACGHQNVASEADRQNLIWRCAGCRALWDQDENAARNCLAAALDAATSAEIGIKPDSTRRKPPRLTRKKVPA